MKKLDLNQPVQTRCGFAARIVCCDVKSNFPILALVTDTGGKERTYSFDPLGASAHGNIQMDLVNVPRTFKAVRWIVANEYGTVSTYRDERHARGAEPVAIKRVEIELTEGEGLSPDGAQRMIDNSR